MISKMELNNGVMMPVIGYGVFQITDLEQCRKCVLDAIEVGYRSIDTASRYGNESAVGKALKECGVPREELFITTKVAPLDAGYENTLRAFDESMKKLQLDYLDLYIIHHPYGDCYGSWRAMERLMEEGAVRAIGVSNFEPYRFVDLAINNEVVPAVEQTETHPFFQQTALKNTLAEFDAKLIASIPLAEGKNGIFTDSMLTEIGAKYHKTAAQVVLRWHIQSGHIIIPKSVHKERMIENLNIFDFELSAEDMARVESMDTNHTLFADRTDPERVKKFCGK